MIEVHSEENSNIIEFKLSGVVTAKDYEEVLIPAIKEKVEKYQKVRVLYQISEKFVSYEFGAMLDDAKAGIMFFNAWEKIAVVSDIEWINKAIKIFSFMVPGEVKIFSNNEIDKAREWLRN